MAKSDSSQTVTITTTQAAKNRVKDQHPTQTVLRGWKIDANQFGVTTKTNKTVFFYLVSRDGSVKLRFQFRQARLKKTE